MSKGTFVENRSLTQILKLFQGTLVREQSTYCRKIPSWYCCFVKMPSTSEVSTESHWSKNILDDYGEPLKRPDYWRNDCLVPVNICFSPRGTWFYNYCWVTCKNEFFPLVKTCHSFSLFQSVPLGEIKLDTGQSKTGSHFLSFELNMIIFLSLYIKYIFPIPIFIYRLYRIWAEYIKLSP